MLIHGIVTDDVPGAFTCPSTGLTVVPDNWHPSNTTREAWDALLQTMQVVGRSLPLMSMSAWERSQKAVRPSCVYFIGGEGTPVKIGFSNMPKARLATLQTGHWVALEILAVVEGTIADETAYHKRFAADRLHGEWFTRTPAIEAEIARLQGGVA